VGSQRLTASAMARPIEGLLYTTYTITIKTAARIRTRATNQSGIAGFEILVELIRTSEHHLMQFMHKHGTLISISHCNLCTNMKQTPSCCKAFKSHHKHDTDAAFLVQQTLEPTSKNINILVIN
jgi:hypothetical protein